jgi:CheY-like chemotaxis protein
MKILIVDNGLTAAEGLAGTLRGCGHFAVCAAHGIEALVMAEEFRPELTVLEMGWMRKRGSPTMRLLRSRPWSRRMVIVGYSRFNKLPGLVDVDCDYCFDEEVDVPRLLQVVDELRARRIESLEWPGIEQLYSPHF